MVSNIVLCSDTYKEGSWFVECSISMMESRAPQKELWSYQVDLDKWVSDRPLRQINEVLELEFVR